MRHSGYSNEIGFSELIKRRKNHPKTFYVCLDKQTGSLVRRVKGQSSNPKTVESWKSQYEVRDGNSEFMATLKIYEILYKGDVVLADVSSQAVYIMFPEDLFSMVQNADLYHGEITGIFGFIKYGQKQGIYLKREVKFDENGQIIPPKGQMPIPSVA